VRKNTDMIPQISEDLKGLFAISSG